MANTEVGTAYVTVVPSLKGFQKQVSSEVGSAFGGLKSAVKGIAIGNIVSSAAMKGLGALQSSLGSAVSRVDTLNNYPKVMASMGTSTDEATASINQMSEHLGALPTRLDAMSSSVQGIYSACSSMGVSLDDATKAGLGLNDLLLAGGAGAEAAEAATVQFTQALAKGKPEMEDWRSLTTAAPAQMNQLAESMLGAGKNSTDLYNALKSGDVTMQDVLMEIARLDSEGGEGFASFYDQAQSATGGIGTSMANLQNSVTKGVANVIQAIGPENITAPMNGLKTAVNDGFGVAIEAIDGFKGSMSEKLEGWEPSFSFDAQGFANGLKGAADAVGEFVGGAFANLVTTVDEVAGKLQEVFGEALPGFLDSISPVKDALSQLFSPLADFIQGDGPAFEGMMSRIGEYADLIGPALQNLGSAFGELGTALQPVVDVLGPAIAQLFGYIGSAIVAAIPVLANIASVVVGVIATVVEVVTGIVTTVADVVTAIWNAITGFVDSVAEVPGTVAGFFTGIGTKIASFFSNLPGLVSGIFNRAVAFVKAVPGRIAGFFTGIGGKVKDKFSSMPGLVKGVFDKVVDKVRGIPGEIVGFFRGLGRKITDAIGNISFPKPHVSWSNEEKGGLSLPLPHVSWYAKGAVFPKAVSVFGEKDTEMALPLNARSTRPFAEMIGGFIGMDAQAGKEPVSVVNNFYQRVQTPAEFERTMRMMDTYGLAGAR